MINSKQFLRTDEGLMRTSNSLGRNVCFINIEVKTLGFKACV